MKAWCIDLFIQAKQLITLEKVLVTFSYKSFIYLISSEKKIILQGKTVALKSA